MEQYERVMSLIEEVREVMSEARWPKARSGFSKNRKNPFRFLKKGKSLGPAIRGGKHRPKDYWACKCKNYSCRCTGAEGEKKVVTIDKAYKGQYNNQYRAWRGKPRNRKRFKRGGKGSKFMAKPRGG